MEYGSFQICEQFLWSDMVKVTFTEFQREPTYVELRHKIRPGTFVRPDVKKIRNVSELGTTKSVMVDCSHFETRPLNSTGIMFTFFVEKC